LECRVLRVSFFETASLRIATAGTTVELLGLVRRLMKLKIELIAVNGGFPGLGTAEGRLMFTMLAACCEYV
jgi:hypothetical protein